MRYRIGIDVGGTFTDLMLLETNTGRSHFVKIPSTPKNPAEAFLQSLDICFEEAKLDANDVMDIVHGTTIAANAVLEGKGAVIGLITTDGFADVLEIARQNKPHLLGFQQTRPEPLVPRNFRKGVRERTLSDGTIGKRLHEEDVVRCVQDFKRDGIKTIVVSLLFSYTNPSHEKRIKDIITKEYPEAKVYLSSEILPEYREYERTATVALHAYVAPLLSEYVRSLDLGLRKRGLDGRLHLIQSNGGSATPQNIVDKPANTLLSGPAAGVMAASYLGKTCGCENVISYSMGGTSTDIALICDGQPKLTTRGTVGNHPLKSPMIEINCIGAGGGSVAWVDAGGILRVGPESAGADPGPACYGKGGERFTVTDANLLLGRLNPDYFLGGKVKLNSEPAMKAAQSLATTFNRDILSIAESVLAISDSNIINAIKRISTAKGYDPRDFVLMAYGGASGLNAGEILEELGLRKVIIPPKPSIFCALGCAISEIRHDFMQTRLCDIRAVDDGYLTTFELMADSAVDLMGKEGIEPENIILCRSADMRYIGQSHEVTVTLPEGSLNKKMISEIRDAFNREYERQNGYCSPEEPTEIVTLRLTAIGVKTKPVIVRSPLTEGTVDNAFKFARDVTIGSRSISCPVLEREGLLPGSIVNGPALIEGPESTILVYPDQRGYVDEFANVILERR